MKILVIRHSYTILKNGKPAESNEDRGWEIFEMKFPGTRKWRKIQEKKFKDWFTKKFPNHKFPILEKDIDFYTMKQGDLPNGFHCWCALYTEFIAENYEITHYACTENQHHYLVKNLTDIVKKYPKIDGKELSKEQKIKFDKIEENSLFYLNQDNGKYSNEVLSYNLAFLLLHL